VAFTGPIDELHSRWAKVREIAKGKFAAEARDVAGEAVFREAVEGWRSGTSPYGERWTGAKGRPITLFKTGSLFRSMKLNRSPIGFSITVDGQDFGRHTLATVQAYGGRIRATKGKRAREAASRGVFGDRWPMTFKAPDGKWRSKFEVRIHPNPMLPKGTREIPPRWAKAIEDEIEALGSRRFGLE
jgi:hypothetical protein